jgi:hypothetical protein
MSPQILALMTALANAGCFVSARRGLVYSTPMTAAYVAVVVNTTVLGVLRESPISEPPSAAPRRVQGRG